METPSTRAWPQLMGICNITPDSFSDGGAHADTASALAHARTLCAAGATIIDVGGESTRPGSDRIGAPAELERIADAVQAMVTEGMWVSVDTLHAQTAAHVLAAGAKAINDVSGGLWEPDILRVVAEHPQAYYLLGHWRGRPETMNSLATYADVLAELKAELSARIDAAVDAGVRPEQIVLDPGIGFAKNPEHNWEILANLHQLELGFPLMIGVSRKRFLADLAWPLAANGNPADAGPHDRDLATAVITALLAGQDLWAVRVHDVAASAIALKQARLLHRYRRGPIT